MRQFAGKERDTNTGLDYFGARYYRAQSGRFTSVDPVLNIDAAMMDPQRWNRYAYARNNPFAFVDPDGRDVGMVSPYSRRLMANAGIIRDATTRALGNSQHPLAILGRGVIDSVLASFLPRDMDEATQVASTQIFGLAAPIKIGAAGTFARLKPVNLPAWRTVGIDMAEIIPAIHPAEAVPSRAA